MGAEQLALNIHRVDEEATKNAVEKYLKQAREYMVTDYIPEEASVTASISDTPRSYTGLTSDQTGNIATRNVDEPERRRRHVERAERAISRLGTRQQKLIRIRYINDDDVMDTEAAEELGFSDRHYRRIKSMAIYRLAGMLGLVMLLEE
ncbi:ArpU family phage packaging/lysis transcriptional regulator [Paenibacillus graminis]|uniref:ArpU family phage packaging/lysis transcriptional regulator n=1 Tax=Paenibacillus graminis TaxID=189425 RepID=UPI002DBBF4AC|nr:ArpU family phage packaging/lysis transcriptional regulator [Paenibacillus graminis]MEC0171153.1 ArpU family phage packaging/lysis transcriptional regulator [Paenibacillus graminis]